MGKREGPAAKRHHQTTRLQTQNALVDVDVIIVTPMKLGWSG